MSARALATLYGMAWAVFVGVMFGGMLANVWRVQFVGTIGVIALGFVGTIYLWQGVCRNPPPLSVEEIERMVADMQRRDPDPALYDGSDDPPDGLARPDDYRRGTS